MRSVTQEIVRRSETLVVMNSGAGHMLAEQYHADPARIRLIHHGTPDFNGRSPQRIKQRLGLAGRTVIATFGLINRNKGLEHAVEAMAMIAERHPEAIYVILGQTHPVVRRREGEVYREALAASVENYGLHDHVRFVNHYLTKEQLIDYLVATDIYLTPYLVRNQLCSGALAYAVGAGKPIVSTPYWYALDILRGGRGMIVDFRDPRGIADACNLLLDSPELRQTLASRTRRLGNRMVWRHVAGEYVRAFCDAAAGASSQVRRLAPAAHSVGQAVPAVGKKPV
jgi:glycosyltransferase involved in cell wall biosynthesis